MAKTIRTVIVRNDLLKKGAQIHRNMVARVPTVAGAGRDALRDELESGGLPIQSDTAALAQSLAVQGEKGSDFDARRSAAKSAYLNNPSRYSEEVRKHVTPSAYTDAHFEERAATQAPPLPQSRAETAGILTMLVWGMLWEFGHQNQFTGQSEQRPWFEWFLIDWWVREAEDAFSGLAA